MQARVPVLPGDDAGKLAARVLQMEHRIYPEVARLIAAGRIEYRAGQASLDGELLAEPLQYEIRPSAG